MKLDRSGIDLLSDRLLERVGDRDVLFSLNGSMGSGKTFFTASFLRKMGVEDRVTSPTYSFVKEYFVGDRKIVHIDAQRLKEGEVESIGFYEYLDNFNVVIIEWADNILKELPKEYIRIDFKRLDEEEFIEVKVVEKKGDRDVHISF